MLKLKCSGEGTLLTNFQIVKNEPMGPNFFEFYEMYAIMTHVFSKLQVTKNCQCYHEAIFNPKSSQKWPKIAIFPHKMKEAVLDSIYP